MTELLITNSRPLRSRADRRLFVGGAIGALLIVLVGFARTYFLKFWCATPALPWLVHLHGAVMTSWFLLFLAQTCLIARHRTDLHRRLGAIGAVLAVMMVVLGMIVVAHAAAREVHAHAKDAPFFLMLLALDPFILLVFAALTASGVSVGEKSADRQHVAISKISARPGEIIGISEWLRVEQSRVDAFAAATDDPDWMHVDIERAREGPLGQTISQGFLTLALLLRFVHQHPLIAPEQVEYAFNYGLNRVRWITPVLVGERIRNHCVLKEIRHQTAQRVLITTYNTVEIEGRSKPAMIAEWLSLVQMRAAPSASSPVSAPP